MSKSLKKILSLLVPGVILRIFMRQKAKFFMKRLDDSDSRNIFESIYREKIWSDEETQHLDFYSGIGSDEKFTERYETVVSRFILENGVRTVIDLGCGDFRVGRRILEKTECQYIGVDIVDDLIQRNSEKFSTEQVSFVRLDISQDELPDGDLCLIRQVLQHLNNDMILNILSRVRKYRYCIITESQHRSPKAFNLDIKSGQWTRTLFGSGLYFDKPPFSQEIETLIDVPRNEDIVIHTCLLNQKTRS